MSGELLDLTKDLVFQELFGKQKNKEITAHLLSLILKRFNVRYALELFSLAKNFNISYPCGFLPHRNVEDSKNIIVNVLQKPGIYAIFLKEKNVLVGCINLKFKDSSNLAVKNSEAELGFWIGEPFWGNGFSSEACVLILEYGFLELNLIFRVYLIVVVVNLCILPYRVSCISVQDQKKKAKFLLLFYFSIER